MVPKHFQGKEGAILAALMRGAEIGLAPMQALSNIAVINGRASIWGDALPALMQRHGHQIDHKIEGEGDARKAVATLIRGDTGQRIVREFSVTDAKAANLWGKQGPWQTYPDRMLGMRARSWACRDGAADAMMGISVAEEQQDVEPMRDVTPKRTGFEAMAEEARQRRAQEAAQIAQADPAPDDTEEGDEASEDATAQPDEADIVDAELVTAEMLVKAKADGETAAAVGLEVTACPYDGAEAEAWVEGFEGVNE